MKAEMTIDVKDFAREADGLFAKLFNDIAEKHQDDMLKGRMFISPVPRMGRHHGGIIKIFMYGTKEDIDRWVKMSWNEKLATRAIKKMIDIRMEIDYDCTYDNSSL